MTQEINETSAYFAPGSVADKVRGVLYQGDYQHEYDGTAVAIRNNVRALGGLVPLLLRSFTANVITKSGLEPIHAVGLSDAVEQEVGEFTRASISKLWPAIKHFVIHKPDDISKRLMRGNAGPLEEPEKLMAARLSVYKSTILYSVWERDSITNEMARELSRVLENWVPCEQNAELLRKSGVDNVFVIPHAYDPKDKLCLLTKRKPIKSRRFYNIGRWEPRKGQVELLRAFFQAFTPEDDVHLTLKYHGQWKDYPSPEEALASASEHWPADVAKSRVTFIEGFVNADQIKKLHFENNIYVAPSHGEAWCIPAFEAKIAGNRLIHVTFGGTKDFAARDDIGLSYWMDKVPDSYGWGSTRWAEYELSDLVGGLKLAAAPTEYVRPSFFEEKFSLDAVGKLMLSRILHLAEAPIREEFEREMS